MLSKSSIFYRLHNPDVVVFCCIHLHANFFHVVVNHSQLFIMVKAGSYRVPDLYVHSIKKLKSAIFDLTMEIYLQKITVRFQ